MEQKQKGGIESIVEARQKKDIFELIGAYAGTAVSAIGAAGSAGMFVFSVYKAITEYAKIDQSMVEAAKAMNESSPYDYGHIYVIMALLAGTATLTFAYGFIEGIKRIRE